LGQEQNFFRTFDASYFQEIFVKKFKYVLKQSSVVCCHLIIFFGFLNSVLNVHDVPGTVPVLAAGFEGCGEPT
jgi:hypothetical protein